MTNFILYDDTTGRITSAGMCETADLAVQGPGTLIVGTGFPETHYVVSGVITPRPDITPVITVTNAGGWTANGVDTYIISGLPNPSLVYIEGDNKLFNNPGPQSITDGTLSMTTNKAGHYKFTIDSFPYLLKILEVDAT